MRYLFPVLFVLIFFSCQQQNTVSIQSPDNKIQVTFEVEDGNSRLLYSVFYENDTIIKPSQVGSFKMAGEPDIGVSQEIISIKETQVDKSWKPIYGERAEIRDNYKQVDIRLKDIKIEREFEITFRVYNEGVAFLNTFLPYEGVDSFIIQEEHTQFKFAENYDCWASDRAQSEISKRKISSIEKPVDRPLVVEAGKNFVALGEAKLIDFARMKFLTRGNDNLLGAELHGEARVALPYSTPWRTIMIGKSPGEILENNFFFENLSDECAIDDVSWIKPGKVIREVTLTTQGGMACVDFAAENGLEYVEFDAGWYGNEYDEASDATTITVDPKRSPGPLDLHGVIKYAESKGIGIIVYVNRRALEKQLDEVLPLLKSWGIKGVKYGFVRVGPQEWTSWMHDAVIKAAENKLMVDIHDEYRPTGFSRTYPNLMTQEGIRGDEETPSNEHTLITLFTRMLAGAGDNTNCYYAPRVQEKMGGNVSQLAKAVMLYSPWQFLYWYDRPLGSPGKKGGAGSSEGYILNHPELDFFKNMPTVWDESKVLESKISKYATLARRSGDDWFLGSLTGELARTLELKTDFLTNGKKYKAKIYSYNPESESSTKVGIDEIEVAADKTLNFEIEKNSGLAIHFALSTQ